MSTPLIDIRGASFGYGRRVVLAGVDLHVDKGAFLGVFGPNGSGKTTLFRGVLGLSSPRTGRVERFTESIGYVPQRERLDPVYPLTVEEVIYMGGYAELRGWRGVSRELRRAADRWLERVELEHKRRSLFASLSGGQRQRALIARALMCGPELVVLDEPTSGVDREAEQRILAILRGLNEEGLAILLVSHQLEVVSPSLKDAIWVDEGRVRHGVLEEIRAQRPVPDVGQALRREEGAAS